MRFVQFANEKFTLHTKMRLKVLFFSNAKLSGAILSDADLKEANLPSTNLSGANLTDADLRGIDFTTTILKNATLDDAKYCKTKMPWGELNDDCEE